MSKHTPGPWTYAHKHLDHFTLTSPYLDENEAIIRGCGCCGSPSILSEADARLIAASPDLLEALQKLLEYTGYTGNYSEKAQAAIAKATGESPK